jgi:hypothetical protein
VAVIAKVAICEDSACNTRLQVPAGGCLRPIVQVGAACAAGGRSRRTAVVHRTRLRRRGSPRGTVERRLRRNGTTQRHRARQTVVASHALVLWTDVLTATVQLCFGSSPSGSPAPHSGHPVRDVPGGCGDRDAERFCRPAERPDPDGDRTARRVAGRRSWSRWPDLTETGHCSHRVGTESSVMCPNHAASSSSPFPAWNS